MPRWWAGALIAALSFGCGGDTHEAVAAQQIVNLNELTAILREVKDSEAMSAAQAKIEAHAAIFRATAKRALALPPPSDDVRLKLSDKVSEMQASLRAFQAETARVAALPGGADFIERIQKQSSISGAAP